MFKTDQISGENEVSSDAFCDACVYQRYMLYIENKLKEVQKEGRTDWSRPDLSDLGRKGNHE